MLSNIKSKIKDFESKGKPPPPPPTKPRHLASQSVPEQASSDPCKRGLGWPWDHPASLYSLYAASINSKHISWVFNWELWRPEGTPANIEWVPCVRTAAQAKDIIPFLTDITSNQHVEIKNFLGFNEPEIPDQANLSVDEAVRLWKESVLPAKAKFSFRLGSPGMSSDVARSKPWLNAFFSQIGDSSIDFLVVHWYGPHFSDMQRFLEDMHSAYNLPIWLNEFACSTLGNGHSDVHQIEGFIQEALPWLDACPWIERYAYFGHGQGGTVGDWVGIANNFYQSAPHYEEADGKALSRVGKLYTEF